mgnify:CR=1 FL=1
MPLFTLLCGYFWGARNTRLEWAGVILGMVGIGAAPLARPVAGCEGNGEVIDPFDVLRAGAPTRAADTADDPRRPHGVPLAHGSILHREGAVRRLGTGHAIPGLALEQHVGHEEGQLE